ncbi:hypothetical protein cypCar_00046662 [Cyprinus carpio]|nr:hypothetical protein cypCar_00046662 [Cyprinus carpio]
MDSEDLLWFSQRYKPSANVTLNTKNSPLDFHTYWWWKSLQNESTVANYKKVVEVLFSLFPDKDHYSDSSPSRCRTCAVVGNSGNLNRSHYGALIDSQDFVIRTYMNVKPSIKADRNKWSRVNSQSAKEAVFELSVCPLMAKEATSEPFARHVTAMEAILESLACPVTAKEAILELFTCQIMTKEVFSDLLAHPFADVEAISEFSACIVMPQDAVFLSALMQSQRLYMNFPST